MKKYLAIIGFVLCFYSLIQAQGNGIVQRAGTPSFTPTATSAQFYFNTTNQKLYFYKNGAWQIFTETIDRIIGSLSPQYTPGPNDAFIVINDDGTLFKWNGTDWVNDIQKFSEITQITLKDNNTTTGFYDLNSDDGKQMEWRFLGFNVSQTAPGTGTNNHDISRTVVQARDSSSTNELQTISKTGDTLKLSQGGGSVYIAPSGGGGGGCVSGEADIDDNFRAYTGCGDYITTSGMADFAVFSLQAGNVAQVTSVFPYLPFSAANQNYTGSCSVIFTTTANLRNCNFQLFAANDNYLKLIVTNLTQSNVSGTVTLAYSITYKKQ